MTTRPEVEAAVRAVIADHHASYFLRHECAPAKALDATVKTLVDQLVWPALIRLDVASYDMAEQTPTEGPPPPQVRDTDWCQCEHNARGHFGLTGVCRWCGCAAFTLDAKRPVSS